jgi:hypothetical protein
VAIIDRLLVGHGTVRHAAILHAGPFATPRKRGNEEESQGEYRHYCSTLPHSSLSALFFKIRTSWPLVKATFASTNPTPCRMESTESIYFSYLDWGKPRRMVIATTSKVRPILLTVYFAPLTRSGLPLLVRKCQRPPSASMYWTNKQLTRSLPAE